MHYPITLSLQLSRGFAFCRREKKKKRRGGGVEWRKFTTVSRKVAKRDAERSFLESNCLPLNPASRLCSRVFVLTELIPPPVGRKLPIEADPHHPPLSSAPLHRVSAGIQDGAIYNESLSYFEGPPALLFLLSNRTPDHPLIPAYSKRPLIAEFFF